MLGDKYATLTDLKSRLSITDTNDDARLTFALSTASRGIEQATGRQYNTDSVATSRLFRPDAAYVCAVDDFQQTSDLAVTVNSSPWTADRYELDPLNGVVDGVPGWPFWRLHAIQGSTFYPVWPGKANIQVTALWGWSAVPDPIHEACLIAAEEIFKLRDTPFGIGGYGAFGVIQIRNNPFVMRILAPYMRYPILAA